jgi:hypothetical protein
MQNGAAASRGPLSCLRGFRLKTERHGAEFPAIEDAASEHANVVASYSLITWGCGQ